MPSGFDSLKALVMIPSLQNIFISGAQGLLMLLGSKVLIKMTRPQCFVAWSSLSKILIPSTLGGLEHLKLQCFAVRSSLLKF